jgi:hypothetical protein
VTTLTDGRTSATECPGCGEYHFIAGYGVCLGCRQAGRQFEVA